jgi:hypothetical protein
LGSADHECPDSGSARSSVASGWSPACCCCCCTATTISCTRRAPSPRHARQNQRLRTCGAPCELAERSVHCMLKPRALSSSTTSLMPQLRMLATFSRNTTWIDGLLSTMRMTS